MQQKQNRNLYTVKLELPSGAVRAVLVKASTEDAAMSRAFKRIPEAVAVRSITRETNKETPA